MDRKFNKPFPGADNQKRYSHPEKNLWSAVLRRAMEDVVVNENIADKRIKEQTNEWFKSNLYDTGSFAWIIDMLGLTPHAMEIIREKLERGERICDEFSF